jgi:hypothetical protein
LGFRGLALLQEINHHKIDLQTKKMQLDHILSFKHAWLFMVFNNKQGRILKKLIGQLQNPILFKPPCTKKAPWLVD